RSTIEMREGERPTDEVVRSVAECLLFHHVSKLPGHPLVGRVCIISFGALAGELVDHFMKLHALVHRVANLGGVQLVAAGVVPAKDLIELLPLQVFEDARINDRLIKEPAKNVWQLVEALAGGIMQALTLAPTRRFLAEG